MLTFEEWRHTYADVFETDDAARAAWTAACNRGYRPGTQDTRALLAAHSAGAQGEIPSCDVERMRAAFESARPAVKKFHYQWDTRRQCYLLDGDEDRGQYMQNEFADWCEAWCAAIASQPMPQTDASRHLSDLLARIHRDGGHYETQYGIEKATADAEMKVAQLNEMTDEARDAQDAKRYRLLRERHFVRADNPNTTAYHCVGIFTSWLPAPTIDHEGLDAVLDAEIERLDRAKGE